MLKCLSIMYNANDKIMQGTSNAFFPLINISKRAKVRREGYPSKYLTLSRGCYGNKPITLQSLCVFFLSRSFYIRLRRHMQSVDGDGTDSNAQGAGFKGGGGCC